MGSVTQFISVMQLVKIQLAPGLCATPKKTNWKKQYHNTATDNLVYEGPLHCLRLADRELTGKKTCTKHDSCPAYKSRQTNGKSKIRDEFCRRNQIAEYF